MKPLIVSEIFGAGDTGYPTIQGEGAFAGSPSVFLRLGGCNFTCEGFGCEEEAPDGTIVKGCDSIYSVSTKFKDTWTPYTSSEDLIREIDYQVRNVKSEFAKPFDLVITGGEPLMQYKNQHLIDCLEYYIGRGHRVTIETNASINIDFEKYPIYKLIVFTMSVKLAVSGELEKLRVKPKVISNIINNTQNSHFKFVVSKEEAENGLLEIISILKQVPEKVDVYLMPLGMHLSEIDYNIKQVANAAMAHQFKITDRLHVRIFGAEKGT